MMISFRGLFFGLVATLALSSVSSSPVHEDAIAPGTHNRTHTPAAVSAIPSAPRFVVYSDQGVSGQNGPPPVFQIQGFNVFILSFLLASGPADQARVWAQLGASARSAVKAQYANAGVSLIVSAFGSTDTPTTDGRDPVALANTMAAWVKQNDLDGIDVDYEDFAAMDKGDGSAENWISKFTQQLRAQLPQGQFILSHAPVAPWFSENSLFPAGAYLKVHQQVGNLIDWYNVQFYNQGTYSTCDTLLNKSSGQFPNSALFQIADAGLPLNKLVIGKPATANDAADGFIALSTLATCVSQAKSRGWNAGVMTWEFPNAQASWIRTVRGAAFPL